MYYISRKKLDSIKLTKKRDITEIVAGLNRRGGKEVVRTSEDVPGSIFYSDIAERVMMRRNARQKTVVELENVNDSSSSVFQTLKGHDSDCSVDSMKIQVSFRKGKVKVIARILGTELEIIFAAN